MRLATTLAIAALAAAFCAAQPARAEDEKTPEVQIVDLLNKIYGSHPGARANHAKGVLIGGMFKATPEAAKLSKAAHFQGAEIPVTVRFSDAGGNPDVADGSKDANPHGFAVKFQLPDGSQTDMVDVSLRFFPVATAADFRDLLSAAIASGKDAPKPTKLDEFMAAHPAAPKALGTASTPASFATETYYGIDAFRFTNKAGEQHYVRYRVVPAGEPQHLDADEAAKRAPNFLIDDIKERLAKGPVVLIYQAQIAKDGDPIADATKEWPEDRQVVELGRFTLTKVLDASTDEAKSLLFLPGQVTDGIEPSDDPLIASRDAAYAESFARRTQ